ncbi:MAG TPA: YggS family pyridoxal phosphate-dependent enzyme [Bacteroidia bacterium]|nr:YggS family pyridoxal phosphate-dependent enzyme [Bacteroidia bacterium]
MSSISENISLIKSRLPEHVTLIAVSKTKSNEEILEAYRAGQRDFGENRVQELVPKYEALPKDIRWHLIGHLQTNKVKYVAPFVYMIHSIDSEKLLEEVNKQAAKCNRIIPVLLQVFIAKEETKFGFSEEELTAVMEKIDRGTFSNISLSGLMGMASNTEHVEQVRAEFSGLKQLLTVLQTRNPELTTLSTGMSSDWPIAVEEGSTMIRLGSSIFGSR